MKSVGPPGAPPFTPARAHCFAHPARCFAHPARCFAHPTRCFAHPTRPGPRALIAAGVPFCGASF